VSANAGYVWPLGLDLEKEFAFRASNMDRISDGGGAIFEDGDAHSYSIMTNAYCRCLNATPSTPYIGGGIGESTVVFEQSGGLLAGLVISAAAMLYLVIRES
jgi:hypothetical protein